MRAILRVALPAVLLSGCVTLQAVSVGHIGCHEAEISVDNVQERGPVTTWDAMCRGKSYVCSSRQNGRYGDEVACSPAVTGLVAPSDAEQFERSRRRVEAELKKTQTQMAAQADTPEAAAAETNAAPPRAVVAHGTSAEDD